MSKFQMIRGRAVAQFDWPEAQKRFSDPIWSTLAPAYAALNEIGSASQAKLQSLAGDENYTAKGRANLMRDWARSEALPALRKGRDAMQIAQAAVDSLRSGMKGASIDKTDAAGAMRRREWRERFASMQPAERAARLLTDSLPDEAVMAVLEMPAEFSGLSEEQHARLEQRALLARHPEEAAKIEALGEAMEALATATRAAADGVQKDADLTRPELEEMLGGPSLADRIRARIGDLPGREEEEAA